VKGSETHPSPPHPPPPVLSLLHAFFACPHVSPHVPPSSSTPPLLSPSRPAGPAVPPSGRLTTHDALSYLREVKQRFAGDKRVYDTFLNIMKEFKAQQ